MKLPEHILLVDKPTGITSFDVIRKLRQQTGIRKYGHAGTLDPAASGLMILGRNEGTKLLGEYLKLPKEYVAEILIGERRSTGDMDGVVLEAADVPEILEHVLKETLQGMVGTLRLSVSAYSAIKKDGVPMYKRAYKAAEKGEVITDVPVRDMEVYEATFLGSRTDNAKITVTARFFVASGTYIRSLAEEYGTRLGYPATLKSLRRTKIGEISVEDAMKLG